MSLFLGLLDESDKGSSLLEVAKRIQCGESDKRVFEIDSKTFAGVPGSPFCYWISAEVLSLFGSLKRFDAYATPCHGISTLDDFRFVRCWWEIKHQSYPRTNWVTYSKGEENVPFYDGLRSVLKWSKNGSEVKNYVEAKVGSASRTIQSQDKYFRPGVTWVRRTHRLCLRPLPAGAIFSGGAQAIFTDFSMLSILALASSSIFDALTKTSVGRTGDAVQFELGMLAKVPTPNLTHDNDPRAKELAECARGAWSLQRKRDSVNETSLVFQLPEAIQHRLNDYDPSLIRSELSQIQAKIDRIAFDVYGVSEVTQARTSIPPATVELGSPDGDEDQSIGEELAIDCNVIAWAVGVAFGRFDCRVAKGERVVPPEPDPFEPVPAKSPGMLLDGSARFHTHSGMLVDETGHEHDLNRIVEEVLICVDVPVPADLRRWLQRAFFSFHLQRYTKSRRKAPIYWPLATASGSYTLWLYYPDLNVQTLYTAVNDFIEPRLAQVSRDAGALRTQGTERSREGDQMLEALRSLEQELTELRDTLLQIAPTYRPNHDDGVQITAAPLWPMFRHKPWQKLLKETWGNLENGDYDWSHLAMAYWPRRVREKCRTDKSLAIAHGLEELYEPPPASASGPGRGDRKRRGAAS